MNDCYSPHTGEHIRTAAPADWMGRAGTPAPDYDPTLASAFWRGGDWEVVEAQSPANSVPAVVSMRQARLALHAAGLLDAVSTAIESMSGVEGDAARIEWEYAQEIRRDWPVVVAVGSELGLSNDQLDALFQSASLM